MLASGLGHATSFRGSDSIICIPGARYYYGEPDNEVCINSVNASEHSVSTTCIFTMGEKEMFEYYMKQFPTGILSMISTGSLPSGAESGRITNLPSLCMILYVYGKSLEEPLMSKDIKY